MSESKGGTTTEMPSMGSPESTEEPTPEPAEEGAAAEERPPNAE